MPTSDPLAIVRYLDVALVVLAAPFVILMGGPVLGYLVGGGTWIVSRLAGALMGRAWILGITILVVGIAGDREDGLMAALLALVAFSIYFATTLITRPMERNTPRP